MKMMFASDIHGSRTCLEQLLDRWRAEGSPRLILLGDLLYHGPRNDLPEGYDPKGVIALLNELFPAPLCVRGNCDAEVDQMVLRFPILADYMLLCADGHTFFVTHGHLYHAEQLPPLQPGDILVHGHTHIPSLDETNGLLYLNPGSISLPKAGSVRSYMICEDGVCTLKALDGEILRRRAL